MFAKDDVYRKLGKHNFFVFFNINRYFNVFFKKKLLLDSFLYSNNYYDCQTDEEDFEDSMQTESAEEDEDADIESDTENESKSNQDESKVNDEDETSEQNVDETAPKATSNGKHREQDDSLKDNHTLKNADATHTHTSKKHAHISKESITHNQQFTSRDQNASNDCDWAEIDPEMLSLCSGVFESQPQTAHSSKCLSKENPNQLTFSGTPIEEGKSQSEHPTSTLSGSSYTDFRFSPQPDDDPEEYDKNVFCEVFESHNTRTPSVDYKKTNNVPHATDDPMSHTTGDIFAQYDIQNGDEDSEEGDEDSEKGDEDSEEGDEDTDDFRNAAGSTSKSFIDDAALETDDDECDDYDNDDHKDIGLYKQPRKTAFQRKRHASQLQPTKNSISDIYCKVNTQSPGSISSKKNCQAHARTEANAMTKTSKDMYFGNGTTAASSIESFTNTQGDSDTDSNGEDLGGEEEDEADRLLTDDSDDDEDDGDNFNNDNDDQDNDNNRSTAVEFQNEDSLFKRVFPTASSSSGSSSRRHFSTFAADSVDGRLPSEDENEEYDEEEEERLFRRAEFASHISLIRNENSQNSVRISCLCAFSFYTQQSQIIDEIICG